MSADRDTLSILEARIADQDDVISGLKRQIDAVRHIALDTQRAQNALVSFHGSLIIVCPDCGTNHLASSAYRTQGVWYLVCRHCGVVPWRARL